MLLRLLQQHHERLPPSARGLTLAGSVAEGIVFGGALRTGVMTAVEDYLTAKWL